MSSYSARRYYEAKRMEEAKERHLARMHAQTRRWEKMLQVNKPQMTGDPFLDREIYRVWMTAA